ncbi:amino acid adenylation domain-containing protein [Mycolicibacterium sp.]|uniref:amino acid adenylation domain-containing protein n=1 Tax=Mycolicibacterium sp. TaxID=2320850 RepID=UPI0034181258
MPLSYAQNRLWFLNRFEGGVATYNMPTAFRINGDLDIGALDAALDDVIARHESLRTTFPDVDGVPFQNILRAQPGMWRRGGAAVVSLPEDEVLGELLALATYQFDLSTEIPLRAQIYSIGPEQHVVAIVVHHIAFDGWSLAPMVRDMAVAYAARRNGEAPGWDPLVVQYADYALWQQDSLGSESDPESVIARQLRYWCDELAELPALLSLPTDHVRPPMPSYRGDGVDLLIGPQTWSGIKAVAAAHHATPSMVLQAVVAVVLHRVGVGEDVVMGTPIAGRSASSLDDLVGFFVNTWVLRVGIDSRHTFDDVLNRVRQKALNAYGNQDVPFERLVEQLNPTRSTSHHPLFQVLTVFQNNVGPQGLAFDEVSIEPLAAPTHTVKFDLEFELREVPTADGAASMAVGMVSYATDLFDRSTIERIATWFGQVVEAVVADPSAVIGDVPLLDRDERELLLTQWAGADVVAPVGPAPQLLAAAAAAHPNAVAIIDGARRVSYRELDEWSNRLARMLIGAGVGPERAVGVAMDRSVELVAAWWAVNKAGGAYVPVDLAHPAERIAGVLKTVEAVCVLTRGTDAAHGIGARPVFRVDGVDVSGWSADPITDADRLVPLGVDNTAHVFFTSGSTGAPKGVSVSHAGLYGVAALDEMFGVTVGSRVLMAASPTFDVSVGEMLLAVRAGAALVVVPADAYSGEAMTRLILRQRVSTVALTPPVLALLDRTRLGGVQTVITSGEACPGELMSAWAPGRRMFNAYGPTETTIWATCSAPMSAGQPVVIGGPIAGVRALVLDARLKPTPIGVVGELYLYGPAIARGYVERPGLTAQRFVANPHGAAGARMYRTGDLVRWTAGRTLDYLGRSDTQIKLRGQRIELGEIESTLLASPQVSQATASVHRGATGDHLVAYITLERTTTSDDDAEIVDQWQGVYEELYGAEVAPSGFGTDFRGWNSSYTDEPIPLGEMLEWQSATAARITALRPRRVLEIGAGSGLVLSQIAPACEHYVATDMSAAAIENLARSLKRFQIPWRDRVELHTRPAHVTDGLPRGYFDTIILNSVIQYFPNDRYLADLLDAAMALLAPGGAIFIGDVRNHALQGVFQTSVALSRTNTSDADEIRQRVQRAMLSEAELLVAPEFFTTWADEQCLPVGLDIQVKRGPSDNEMNWYRYDVVIHEASTPARSVADVTSVAWTQCAGLLGLHTWLASERPAAVRVTEIPRAGLFADVGIERAIAEGLSLAEALARGSDAAIAEAVAPEQLHRIGEGIGYDVAVTWGARAGTLDAVFIARGTPSRMGDERHPPVTDIYLPVRQRASSTNDPHTNTKIGAVREWLASRLPDYMVPAQIMVLDEFPLTSSGKLNRKALPTPIFAATTFRPPQTDTERMIAEVYARVLGLDRVGVDESFFDLGGDSLLAMPVIDGINKALGTQLAVRTIFDTPSVRGLSQHLGEADSAVQVVPVEFFTRGAGDPLCCIHDGLGLSWSYRVLGNHLDCPVIGINQISVSGDTAPGSIREMAACYADKLQTISPHGPYKLLGWSLGGVVAHEMAIELQRRGCDVRRLVVLDSTFSGNRIVARSEASGETQILEHILRINHVELPDHTEPLTYRQAAELIHQHPSMAEHSLVPTELLEFMTRSLTTNQSHLQNHAPGVFDGDIVVFSATRDEDDGHASELARWRQCVTGDVTIHPVDCTHHEMLSPESLGSYVERLKVALGP